MSADALTADALTAADILRRHAAAIAARELMDFRDADSAARLRWVVQRGGVDAPGLRAELARVGADTPLRLACQHPSAAALVPWLVGALKLECDEPGLLSLAVMRGLRLAQYVARKREPSPACAVRALVWAASVGDGAVVHWLVKHFELDHNELFTSNALERVARTGHAEPLLHLLAAADWSGPRRCLVLAALGTLCSRAYLSTAMALVLAAKVGRDEVLAGGVLARALTAALPSGAAWLARTFDLTREHLSEHAPSVASEGVSDWLRKEHNLLVPARTPVLGGMPGAAPAPSELKLPAQAPPAAPAKSAATPAKSAAAPATDAAARVDVALGVSTLAGATYDRVAHGLATIGETRRLLFVGPSLRTLLTEHKFPDVQGMLRRVGGERVVDAFPIALHYEKAGGAFERALPGFSKHGYSNLYVEYKDGVALRFSS